MTNKTLEQRIAELEQLAEAALSHLNIISLEYGMRASKSNVAREALKIIRELQTKPCEYIYQGGDGTSYCKLAASHGKELEEARRVIEELKAKNSADAKEHHEDFKKVAEENEKLQRMIEVQKAILEIHKEAYKSNPSYPLSKEAIILLEQLNK